MWHNFPSSQAHPNSSLAPAGNFQSSFDARLQLPSAGRPNTQSQTPQYYTNMGTQHTMPSNAMQQVDQPGFDSLHSPVIKVEEYGAENGHSLNSFDNRSIPPQVMPGRLHPASAAPVGPPQSVGEIKPAAVPVTREALENIRQFSALYDKILKRIDLLPELKTVKLPAYEKGNDNIYFHDHLIKSAEQKAAGKLQENMQGRLNFLEKDLEQIKKSFEKMDNFLNDLSKEVPKAEHEWIYMSAIFASLKEAYGKIPRS
jgi:hypothetical protein